MNQGVTENKLIVQKKQEVQKKLSAVGQKWLKKERLKMSRKTWAP